MSTFTTYLELGFRHILDPRGIDHILFIVALCAAYNLKDWKTLLILITAFTIGHSLTLALSSLDIFRVEQNLVEQIIAITIGITAMQNILIPKPDKTANRLKYAAALVFGLFHGMGFSTYFSSLLGREEEILLPLFAFNVGIELGQICIVATMLVFFYLAEKSLKIKSRDWNLFLSGIAFGAAIMMLSHRL